jgi:hypothetical protein
MQTHKSLLQAHLERNGWEVTEVMEGVDWWADEHWRIESRWNQWGLELIVTFLVDPMWDDVRKKGEGVWAAIVTESIPEGRPTFDLDKVSVAWLRMKGGKGSFDPQLDAFVDAINTYRNRTDRAEEGDQT